MRHALILMDMMRRIISNRPIQSPPRPLTVTTRLWVSRLISTMSMLDRMIAAKKCYFTQTTHRQAIFIMDLLLMNSARHPLLEVSLLGTLLRITQRLEAAQHLAALTP